MNPARKGLLAAAMLGSVLAGGAVGVALFGPSTAGAQTTTTTPSNSSGTTATTAPTFHSNETPSHEATETPSQEAGENSGTGHCGHSGAGPNSSQTTPSTGA